MARVIFECSSCKKQEDGQFDERGFAIRPKGWLSRTSPMENGSVALAQACGKECAIAVSEATGNTAVFYPL